MEVDEKYLFPNEPSLIREEDYLRLLVYAHEVGASDITIQTAERVIFHISGKLYPVTKRFLTNYELECAVSLMYGSNGVGRLKGGEDIDIPYTVEDYEGKKKRFRVNITACYADGADGIQITARTISASPPTLEFLQVPEDILKAAYPDNGLVLICGPTGSGKSSLLSGLMAHKISQPEANIKLITAESPIEYVYDEIPKYSSSVCQSEVPANLPSFAAAVRNALRRAPDYILIGESRDKETIEACIEAAETGHTVYSTVHSGSVHETLYRLINQFSPEQQHVKMFEVLEVLRIVIVQKLLPRIGGGLIAAREYLIFSDEVRDRLRTAKTPTDLVAMTKDAVLSNGVTFYQSINELVISKFVDKMVAEKYLPNDDWKRYGRIVLA